MAYAVRRPVENVYLVRERDRRRSRELLALSLAALPPMAILFGAIWANLEAVQLGYQVAQATSVKKALVEKKRQLEMERAQLSALARVEKIARGTLGLVPPTLDQVILVEDAALAPLPPAPAKKPPRAQGPAVTEEGF